MKPELLDLFNRSVLYRGEILTQCIILEKDIEMYIVEHFVTDPKKIFDLMELVLDRTTFDNKI